MVVGALPFAPDAPARVVVPALCYVRTANDERVILVGPRQSTGADGQDPAQLRRTLALTALRSASADPPPRVIGLDDHSDAEFTEAVGHALDAIARGTVTKVVLARPVVATFDRRLDPQSVLRRLARREPNATVYGVLDDEAFVGASPELLVARHGPRVESWPLAGTAGLTGDAPHDAAAERALAGSAKELDEHGQTVAAISAALAPFCLDAPEVTGPSVARLRTVAHLASRVTGTLRQDDDALTLAPRCTRHPPWPARRPRSLSLLGSLEPGPRALRGTRRLDGCQG